MNMYLVSRYFYHKFRVHGYWQHVINYVEVSFKKCLAHDSLSITGVNHRSMLIN